jgi:transposase
MKTAAKTDTQIDLKNLPSDPAILHQMVITLMEQNTTLSVEVHSQSVRIQILKDQLALLKSNRYGKSSEKLDTQIEQLELFLEDSEALSCEEEEAAENAPLGIESTDAVKRKPKRLPLPAHLPREDVVLPPEAHCPECGSDSFRKIADDVSETLECIPASFTVIRHIRPRCACTACDRIVQAEVPSKTIAKGKAGPGLLAQLCISKYCDSLPFYRQSEIYAREGVELARSSMASWAGQCARLLEPVVAAIKEEVLTSSHIHGDDTTVPVLAPGLGKTKTGRLWVYVRDGRPHGGDEHPVACYFYSPDRKSERPALHLEGFKGVFHADAYAGYDHIYKDGSIQEVGCWAHARRKFYEATVPSTNASIASDTLTRIGKLYGVEDTIRGQDPASRVAMRKEESLPLIEALFEWWKKSLSKLPKHSLTAKAIQYALNNEMALRRYITDGKAEMDNNAAERAMRKIAIGRKNWLFAGSDAGGETAANFYTIIETARLNGINPRSYLRKLLTVIQDHNSQKMHELLPWNLKLD